MKRALVVDDEVDICMLLMKHLETVGFETQYALTAKEARLKLLSSPYEIMFIDLNLADGSGFDIINFRNKLNLKTKIIVISAYDSAASKAIDTGANFFVTKPFAIKKINEALGTLDL